MFCQVIRHHKEGLLAKAEPFALHGCRHHFKRFPCPHFVSEQSVAAVENVRYCVELMLTKHNFRVHS